MSGQIPKRVRSDVLERDDFTCQRCKVSILGRAYSLHHRKGRHGADAHNLANIITLCGHGSGPGCHWHTHQHPAESYENGLMIRRLGSDSPADVPITDMFGHQFYLTDAGEQVLA